MKRWTEWRGISTQMEILAVLVAIAIGVAIPRPIAGASPRGITAPVVAWKDASGAAVRLADANGDVVLVDFWASWCVPCRTSFPALDVIQRDYRDRGVRVFAVNVDEQRKDADAFLAAHPHTMLVVFDPRGESAKAFKVQGMPSSFVIDRRGEIRFTHQGYSQNVDVAYRRELDTLLAEAVQQ